MHELLAQLRSAARGMWKYRWVGLLVAWLVAIAGIAFVSQIRNKYEASARIFVDTQSILKPLLSGLTVQPDVDQQVAMLSRTLISRPNVEKLVRMADLDLQNKSKAEQEATIDGLMKTLKISGVGRDNLYQLSYQDENPERAKRAVQSLVSIFIESGLGASRKDADSAKVFIDEQIKSYRIKLEEAEARLKEFRLRNLDVQIGDGRDSASRLSELSDLYEKARLELREAENARDAARASLAAEKAQTTSLSRQSIAEESTISVATPELDVRIEAQKRNLDALLQRFTDLHPEVIAAKQLINDLEAQRRKEVASLRKAAMAAAIPTRTVAPDSLAIQELNRLIASSEVQVASLRARVSEYGSRYNAARAALRTAPQLEAEAAQLNRDYSIQKKNYEDLVARRESAVLSGELDTVSGVADFRLIDPPRVSPKPVSPNRIVLFPAAMLASIAAGLLVAFLASQMRPVFYDINELRSRFELPVLGVVTLEMTEARARQSRMAVLQFVAASGALLIMFAGALAMTQMLAGR